MILKRNDVFENDKISYSILSLALPTVISQLITTVYNLADTFWVGRLNDPEQVAALSLVFPTQMVLTALGNLFGIGAGTCISACLGAKQTKRAGEASSFAVKCGCAVSLLFALFTFVFRDFVLNLLGSTANLNTYTNDYLNWAIALGAVPSVFNMITANMIRGEGLSLQASIGLSLGGILNIFLDPFFVLPSFLNMQIKGAAIATLISNLVTTVYFVVLLIIRRSKTVISLKPSLFSSGKNMGRDVVLTGVPSALQTLLSAVSNLVLNSLMISNGEFAEAAVGITKKIDAIPFGLLTGISQGAAPLLAYNYGAGRTDRLKKTLRLSLIYCVSTAAVILVAIEAFAPSIVSLFIADSKTVECGTGFLRLHCISMLFMAVTLILLSFFQSVGAKTKAFVLSIIRKGIVDIPLMFLLNFVVPMYGIVACQPIMDVVSMLCGIFLFFKWEKSFKSIENGV